jgi:hypothetical protein
MTQAIDRMEVALVDLIHKALQKYKPSQIKKISYDGDGKSCEHIGRLYGLVNPNERKMTLKAYRRIEEHWTQTCKERKIPSAIARHVYWDQVQGQRSTNYWSHVFETAA